MGWGGESASTEINQNTVSLSLYEHSPFHFPEAPSVFKNLPPEPRMLSHMVWTTNDFARRDSDLLYSGMFEVMRSRNRLFPDGTVKEFSVGNGVQATIDSCID